MNKEVCKYCHDKGKFSVFRGGGTFGDSFDGRITIQPKIEEMPCLRCQKLENNSPGLVKEVESWEEKIDNEFEQWFYGNLNKLSHNDFWKFVGDEKVGLKVRELLAEECQKAVEGERKRCADLIESAQRAIEEDCNKDYLVFQSHIDFAKFEILNPNK